MDDQDDLNFDFEEKMEAAALPTADADVGSGVSNSRRLTHQHGNSTRCMRIAEPFVAVPPILALYVCNGNRPEPGIAYSCRI